MSKHETLTIEAQVLSPKDFLKANGMYWPAWRVSLHKLWVVARYGVSDSVNELSLIAATIAVVTAAMLVGASMLILSPFVALNGWLCLEMFGGIGTLFFVVLGSYMRAFPFWMRTDVTKQNRFNHGHRGWPDLPEEAVRARDVALVAYPDASVMVDAFAYDPIMTVFIPGEPEGLVVCVWDYKDGKAVILHPV
jgi:hypothetical protein